MIEVRLAGINGKKADNHQSINILPKLLTMVYKVINYDKLS